MSNSTSNCYSNSNYYHSNSLLKNLPFYSISDCEVQSMNFNSLNKQFDYTNIQLDKQYIELDNIRNLYNNYATIMYTNIRSLNCNFENLHQLLVKINIQPAVICMSETWITQSNDFIHTLPGYIFVSKPSNSKHGGVGLFIKEEYEFEVVETYNLNTEDCEDIWIKLEISKGKSVIIGNIYRHPRYNFSKFEENLIKTIQLLNHKNNKYIFGGDLNINLLNNSTNISNFKQNILSLGCSQEIEVGTRFSQNSKTFSLLDHIYTNFNQTEINTNVIFEDLTDHLPTLISIKKFRPFKLQKQKILIQDFKNFNKEHFLEDLELKLNEFSLKYNNENVNNLDTQWNEFESIFNKTVFLHAPLRPMTRREKRIKAKPWLTKGILKSINTKSKLYKIEIKNKSNQLSSYYKRYRNLLTRVKELSKKLFFQKSITNAGNDSKKIWKVINNIINYKNPKHSSIQNIVNTNSHKIEDPTEISNLMNKNFVSLVDELIKKHPPTINNNHRVTYRQDRVLNSFFLNPLRTSEITNYINKLNINKSTRSDLPKIKF